MFKSFAFVSLLTSAAFAQSANPFIPPGISPSCTEFLNSLDHNKDLTSCTSSLVNATAAYHPGSNGTSSPSLTQLQSTLNTLCSPSISNACPQSEMRTWLTDFFSKCSAELTSNPNEAVKALYDVLYTLGPFKAAICSKDDSGSYCVTKIPSTGVKNTFAVSDLVKPLVRTAPITPRADQTALMPNIQTYQQTNLAFLFLQPSDSSDPPALSSDEQCNTCTRNILTAYITAESDVPYGPGLAKSTLLGKQDALYKAITKTCGPGFLSGAVQAAGGLSGGTFPSGAVRKVATSQIFWTGLLAVGVCSFF